MVVFSSRRRQRQAEQKAASIEKQRETETTLAYLNILVKGLADKTDDLVEVRKRLEGVMHHG